MINFVDMLSKLINALGIGGIIMLILITFGVQINSLVVVNIAIIVLSNIAKLNFSAIFSCALLISSPIINFLEILMGNICKVLAL